MSIRVILKYLLVLILFTNNFLLIAQNPDDPISVYSFNNKYLEHLIKEKVDSVRVAHGLKALYNDTILYNAAKYHAQWLVNKGELSHEENDNAKMQSPQQRADQFGAVNYLVGENLVFTLVGKPVRGKQTGVHTNMTFKQTANDLVLAWVNSPPHYKNMLTENFNATGLAISVDAKNNKVYAVQKFAQILYRYEFIEDKEFFSYSNFQAPPVAKSFDGINREMHAGKHVFKLKEPKKLRDCIRCIDTTYRFIESSKIEYKNGQAVFTCYDVYWIFQMLENKKDGFALEVMPYDPYDCGNPAYYTDPSRRNGQCIFSGKVVKPVYLKKALRGFKAGSDPKKILEKINSGKIDRYTLKLGKIPRSLEKNFAELNLVVIQDKKVCRIVKFSGHCGQPYDFWWKRCDLKDSFMSRQRIIDFVSFASFRIPFAKGKSDYQLNDVKPFVDSLGSENFTVDSLSIKAFSSVEGNEQLNKKLQEERSLQITNMLKSRQKESMISSVNTQENWELFEKQIAREEALRKFRGLNHEQIKELLTDTGLCTKIEPFLKAQRYAEISMNVKISLDKNNAVPYLQRLITRQKGIIIYQLLQKDTTNKKIYGLDSLDRTLQTAAYFIGRKEMSPASLQAFYLPDSVKVKDFNLSVMKMQIRYNPELVDSAKTALPFYDRLVRLYNQGVSDFFVTYHLMLIWEKHRREIKNPISKEMQDVLISKMNASAAGDSLKSAASKDLSLSLWFANCKKPWDEVSTENRDQYMRSVEAIHSAYLKGTGDMEKDNRLADFYVLHSRYQWAFDLLAPYYDQNIDNPEGLVRMCKLLYDDWQLSGNVRYYEFLKDVYSKLGKDKWCPMFIGPCNISFQVFDNPGFRDYYCEKCSDYLNYAKSPNPEAKD